MRNILLEIEYDGTAYAGWQVQNASKTGRGPKGSVTVQSTLCAALDNILGEKVMLTGSGRTDAGVHAQAQAANFHTASSIPVRGLQKALNSALPPDIRITACREVPEDFHARYSAKWKLYRYTILNSPIQSALRRHYVFYCDYPLDVGRMSREASALKGTHDFSSFHAAEAKRESSVRTVRRISIAKKGDTVTIEIEANGFLKNMVRTIAGTLIDIGRGRFPAGSMRRILAAKDRKAAGPTAPPQGLCLVKVWY